jgi:hypothetical protein
MSELLAGIEVRQLGNLRRGGNVPGNSLLLFRLTSTGLYFAMRGLPPNILPMSIYNTSE